MAVQAMTEQESLTGFLDKWRARWPEWSVVEVFVPAAQRQVAVAWNALLQEWTDAAWAGSDPRPGEAKLAWWVEELQGWSLGRRRHPLGVVLQRLPAPWSRLAATLPDLSATREPAGDGDQAAAALTAFAEAAAQASSVMFSAPTRPAVVIACLLGEQILMRGDNAAPLQVRAQVGDAAPARAKARAWAQQVADRWPRPGSGSRAARVQSALLRERLQAFVKSGEARPLSRLRALQVAWRAARSVPSG